MILTYSKYIVRKIPLTGTLNFNEENILLEYANVIIVNGKLREEIQRTVTELINIRKGISLIIVNREKIEYMIIERGGGEYNNLRVEDIFD